MYVKGFDKLDKKHLNDKRFLLICLISILLHGIWDMPISDPIYLLHIAITVIAWLVIIYSIKALKMLDEKGVEYKSYAIDDDEDKLRKKIGEYYKIEGNVTVPQIIVNNQRIGGYDDIKKLDEEGKFDEIFLD